MKIRLGYVDGPFSLPISYCHTITYTNFKKLDDKVAYFKLKNIVNTNLDNFLKVLKFNKQNKITFYRMSHTIVPLATHKDVDFDYINLFKEKWIKIGDYIKMNNMRVDSHPNQYCILNSTNKDVVNNSFDILKFNYNLFKAMGIKSKVVLHIGSLNGNKDDAIKRFKENFYKLDKNIRDMVTLENDDKIFNIVDTLNLCEELDIPMTLDYHHYLCNKNGEKLHDYLDRIINTWKNTGLNPKIHFSTPKNKKEFRSHSDFIDYKSFVKFLNILLPFNCDFDIMLECKAKEEALFRLSRQLKFTKGIRCLNTSTFVIKKSI